MFSNKSAAQALEEVATLMRIAGENDFKAIAFDKAARTVESLDEPLSTIIDEGRILSVPGIGKSIAADLVALKNTGTMPVLVSLHSSIPKGLIQWLDISGLGPKNIAKIHKALGITSVDELKAACLDGTVAALSGLGEKSAAKIIKSIDWMEQFSARCRLDEAENIAEFMVAAISGQKEVTHLAIAGSLRRQLETIGDIDILVQADPTDVGTIFDAFVQAPDVAEVLGRGDTKCSIRVTQGRQVDLRIVDAVSYPAALMYFTGSKEHNVFVRGRARERGMALNEYGLFKLTESGDTDFEAPVEANTEEAIYKALGLNFIPPELREDNGNLSRFESWEAHDLAELSDLKGILHAHSTWSDGSNSIAEMAQACIDRGYQYLGLTDHSRTAAYAGGLSIERVYDQWREIDRINDDFTKKGVHFRVFKGIESDILVDGSLDYPDDVLAGFDFVIASVHSSLDLPEDKMTDRFLRAIDNPHTRIIGHPTGRLLLKREGSKLDMPRIIEAAAASNTAIEINASPWRLDLDWRWGKKASSVSLFTAICPDAHSTEGLDDAKYGISIAKKSGFLRERVLNTRDADTLLQWFLSK
jgi:DNA polymerase (family 10)